MATYPTDTHGPSASAPSVTYLVAKCRVCKVQWQVQSDNLDDTKGCSFCDAPASAIAVISEAPDYTSGALVK
jgi:hypothetical protein